jgi:hypothetical protein
MNNMACTHVSLFSYRCLIMLSQSTNRQQVGSRQQQQAGRRRRRNRCVFLSQSVRIRPCEFQHKHSNTHANNKDVHVHAAAAAALISHFTSSTLLSSPLLPLLERDIFPENKDNLADKLQQQQQHHLTCATA